MRFTFGLVSLLLFGAASCGGKTAFEAPIAADSGVEPPLPPVPPPDPPPPVPVPVDAGPTPPTCAVTLRRLAGPPRGRATALAVSSTAVYFAVEEGEYDAEISTLSWIPKTGGAATLLVRGAGKLDHFSVAGGRLYWSRTVGSFGTAERYVEWFDLATRGIGSQQLPAGWSFDYMTAGPLGAYVGVRAPGTESGIYRIAHDGARTLVLSVPAVGAMLAEGDDLYYLTERFNGTLMRRSLSKDRDTILRVKVTAPLVADATHLYAHTGYDPTSVAGISKRTGAIDIRVPGDHSDSYLPIAVRGNDVVWVDSDMPSPPGGYPRLKYATKDASCRQTLFEHPAVLAHDENAIYIYSDEGIQALR